VTSKRLLLYYVCDGLLDGQLIHRSSHVDDSRLWLVWRAPSMCGIEPQDTDGWRWMGSDVEFSPEDDISVTLCLECSRLALEWERQAFESLTDAEHAERAAELARREAIIHRALDRDC
jgi:hypothetical protein